MSESITIAGNSVRLENLEIADKDVSSFFEDTEEGMREEKLKDALRLGVIALRSSETTQNVDYVDKRFEDLKRDFQDEIRDFQDEINDLIGEDGKFIDELDVNKKGSPLRALKNELDERFQNLHDEIVTEEVEEEMTERTSLKGGKFERNLEDVLSPIASTTGDKLKFTGEEEGEIADSKVGDFVVEIANSQDKIVLEAKNTGYSQPSIEEEMDRAIENRDAEYGIFIAKTAEQVPQKVGSFNEYNQNQLVIIASDDGDTISQDYLEIGLKWAKMRVVQMQDSVEDEIDTGEIESKIESAERSLSSFSQIKGACTSIEKKTEKIREESKSIKSDLQEELDDISSAL